MNSWFLIACILIAGLTAIIIKYPLINDITTDFKDPPPIPRNQDFAGGNANLYPYPEEFAAIQARAYPEVRPLKIRVTAETALELIERLVEQTSNLRLVARHPSRPIVLLVATTSLLRFKDDLSIRVEENASHTTLHFRSRSRIGTGDLGANAARILALQKKLNELSVEMKQLDTPLLPAQR